MKFIFFLQLLLIISMNCFTISNYESLSNTDSLLDLIRVKKAILKQEILRKKQYLSLHDSDNYNMQTKKDISLDEKIEPIPKTFMQYNPQFLENQLVSEKYSLKNQENKNSFDILKTQKQFLDNYNYPLKSISSTNKKKNKIYNENLLDFENNIQIKKPNFLKPNTFQSSADNRIFFNQVTNLKEQENFENLNRNFRFKEENQKIPPFDRMNLIELKDEIEKKMLIEISSNFSKFSENMNDVIQQLKKISNETLKNNILDIKTKKPKQKLFFDKNKEKEKIDVILKRGIFEDQQKEINNNEKLLNNTMIQDLINSQIENRFKHYFSLVPNYELITSDNIQSKARQIEKKNNDVFPKKESPPNNEQNLFLQSKLFKNGLNSIDKMDKWEIFNNKPDPIIIPKYKKILL